MSGSTQSLPLVVLTADRALGSRAPQGLTQRHIDPFALVGVVWDDPDVELDGRVQVRTRAAGTARWSGWREIVTHNREHAPDPRSAERTARRVHGATAPLWVGRSDGVQVRVEPSAAKGTTAGGAAETNGRGGAAARGGPGADRSSPLPGEAATGLPRGLRLALVDPGGTTTTTANGARAGASTHPATAPNTARPAGTGRALALAPAAAPYTAPRPDIVTREGWGADESLRESGFVYTGDVRAAFVHHTDTGNDYTCAEAPEVIRGIYRYHVVSEGWRDIGYNFLVDKCGTVYEGRAGGVDKPVKGAHTMGFNNDSTGIAVIGTFMDDDPPEAVVQALAELVAWKLGLSGADPEGKTYLTSEGGNLYPKGEKAELNVVSGHRDGFATDCPGTLLYRRLDTVRSTAARLQGR